MPDYMLKAFEKMEDLIEQFRECDQILYADMTESGYNSDVMSFFSVIADRIDLLEKRINDTKDWIADRERGME